MKGTEGVKLGLGSSVRSGFKVKKLLNFRTCQFFHLNPFHTMKFQYFALISTGMMATHVHLPIMTLIYGLKLNNRYRLMALWCEFTAHFYLNVT